ncbi:MAG: glycosyltransferase family 2 protein [Solirubrobacteraceae bacterium]
MSGNDLDRCTADIAAFSARLTDGRGEDVDETGNGTPPITLSVLMRAYNEERTIAQAIAEVLNEVYPCEFELIVIEGRSTDATPRILAVREHPRVRVVRHIRSLGKGAELLTVAAVARRTHVVPFDAVLEYRPPISSI